MLGTGIASAQENVNPDARPNPLDARVRVPVDVDRNNLGTPVGNHDLPAVRGELRTPSLAETPAGRVADHPNPLVRGTREGLSGVNRTGVTRGNTVGADVAMPVNVCGNAIGAGGDSYTEADCSRSAESTGDIQTDGSYGSLSGNAARAAAAVSPQVTGNAIAALSNAESRTTSDQRATAGGDVRTSGRHGSLSGNVAALQGAAPVQVNGNALAAGGNSHTTSTASNHVTAPGSLRTDGDRSSAGGNVLGVPLAPVVGVSGNGFGAVGNADANADDRSYADAGDTHPFPGGPSMWAETTGKDGTLAGNIAQPSLAGPASADNNALGGVGNSNVAGRATNDAYAGGNSRTAGQDSVLSGNYADAPVALPVAGSGNSASGVGNTSSRHANDVVTVAGGDTYTNGDRSVLSANSANLPPAGAADLCGNGTAAGGIADSSCDNDVAVESGGYNGSTGNDGVVSGNIGQVPVGAPAEAFGNNFGAAGSSTGRTTEDKAIRSGRMANSVDDNGTVSSNVVSAPTVLGGQAFGNTGGAVANPTSTTDSDTRVDLGNPPQANGKHGSASGNIVHVPTSNPAQVFGDSVVGVGNGSSDTTSSLSSRSGGGAVTTGDEGSLSGNVLSVPQASSPQAFGSAIGAGSNVESDTRNEFGSFSGGDVYTSGDRGSFSGNGLGSQATLPLQVFGDAVTAAGNGYSRSDNSSGLIAGGRHLTSAEDASWSGNLLTTPAALAPSAHGDAVTAAGLADARTTSDAHSTSGGDTATTGTGPMTARDLELPAEGVARMFGVPVEVAGTATADAADRSRLRTGEGEETELGRGVVLPMGVDHLMRVTELPSLELLHRLPEYRSPLRAPGLEELRNLPILGRPLPVEAPRVASPTRTAWQAGSELREELPAVKADKPEVDARDLPTSELPKPDLSDAELPTAPLSALMKPMTVMKAMAVMKPVSELPTGVMPRVQEDVRDTATNRMPGTAHVARTAYGLLPATSGERSFSGTLPVTDQLDLTRQLPIVTDQTAVLRDQALPTLPVASPVPLPVVVPVPGLAQPRTAPVLPPAALSGLDVNPLQGTVGTQAVPSTEQLRTPALAGLDAFSLFNSMERTAQLPRI
ncbi:beta strand repeat-containing protein [Saccharothrix lopnurensis]|uniref:Beta strand repeat-containing protein n=1 Tax=Saccharothrix lopnurensis TaxID=1670621 RepID=A0ABW1PDF4_9PSEU